MELPVLQESKAIDDRAGPGPAVRSPRELAALERDLHRAVHGEVRFDDAYRVMFSSDAGNYRQIPLGVVFPKSKEAMARAVAVCAQHGAPIVHRGGGTSLAGQTCGVAVVIDSSKHLDRVLSIDVARRRARVLPGLIYDDLKRLTTRRGLTFGPDPATHEYCTIGGMIGNNSCGVHSVTAGRTSDNIEEMEVLTVDGLRMRVGATSERDLQRLIREPGREGEIYRGLKRIRDLYADEIRARYADIPRRVSGYQLDELLPENGFHVARALVGAEGTCVTVLEATVRLIHWHPQRTIVVLGFDDVFQAADAVPLVRRLDPLAIEGMDERLVDYMKLKGLGEEARNLLPPGGGWLIVEFGGRTREEAAAKAAMAALTLRGLPGVPRVRRYDSVEQENAIWEARESGLGATAFVPDHPDMWPGWEDTAVHPQDLGNYLRELRALMERHGYRAALYGHFGDGLVHCRISFDLRTRQGLDTYGRFSEEIAELIARYRGSLTGEHGEGQARSVYLEKIFGPTILRAFREFKQVWDPYGLMNPGKIVDPVPPTANLREGLNYRPWDPPTHFRFPADQGSFARATLRCVGVGKCRRPADAFMCPSYQVTHDEKDTTRGRARALFEMTRATYIRDGWASKEVLDTLDLCLSCKGCKDECPVHVDIATYKSEFLSHHYAGRLRPRSHYSMGLIGWGLRLAGLAPAAANMFTQVRPLSAIAKRLAGIAPERALPPFAQETFTQWFRKRQRRRGRSAAEGSGRPVLLYPDRFNDHFYPHTLRAATESLERLGYRVMIPEHAVSEVRPLIHFGMLHAAKRLLLREVRGLVPYANADVPIIFLEPSSLSVFTDELKNLFPESVDGDRVKVSSILLADFLVKENLRLPRLNRQAILHLHCHHKAVLDVGATRECLRRLGVRTEEPQATCCGMAGSFGFEAEHYDIAMRVGELRLLPAVREAAPRTLIIADGFSCRTQILHGTGRMPLHLAEVLLMALDAQEDPRCARRPEEYTREAIRIMDPSIVGLTLLAATAGVLAWRQLPRRREAGRTTEPRRSPRRCTPGHHRGAFFSTLGFAGDNDSVCR